MNMDWVFKEDEEVAVQRGRNDLEFNLNSNCSGESVMMVEWVRWSELEMS